MALGRGLGELLGEVGNAYENENTSSDNGLKKLNVSDILANPKQPRKIFDEKKLFELSESIKKHGLLQAIVVIRNDDGKYTLVSGERRLRAHKLAKIDTISAVVTDIEELQLRELALIENIQRDDLNVIELAYSFAQLINEHSITHDELSNRVFKSRSYITNTLRLLQLSSYVQQLLANNKLTSGHAKVMIGLIDDDQKKVSDSVIGQKLSVRETEKLVKTLKTNDLNTNEINKTTISNYNFKAFDNLVNTFKSSNIKVKTEKNYLKIEFNSQDDIDKISQYFNNTL
ncbi:MAG: ParB/RepB/Spo0J family partition protein [Campylobacteraceae bacterium]|nr:ParB/RepB/Spo0J family partition protein [Campylobacteraceae bacterium]